MTTLPPPNVFDSGAALTAPDEAAIAGCPEPSAVAADLSDSKQKFLAAIEDDYRFVLDEEKFMFDIGCAPDSFEKYMSMLDDLIDEQPLPIFLQRTG